VPEPDGGYLAADGGCLHWAVAGAGPAVVAIHGGSADLRLWESLVPALAMSYRVIRYDLRGLGRSEPPTAQYRMAGDVAAVLGHLGEASAALVGFSAEGAIAAEFTVRRDHPETADLCSTRWRLAITGGRAYSIRAPGRSRRGQSGHSPWRQSARRGSHGGLHLGGCTLTNLSPQDGQRGLCCVHDGWHVTASPATAAQRSLGRSVHKRGF
jgi:pimeloyl-ACP methyl ester carboxylesterase